MMIYFGQELGEKGMDSEGFSGEDGRTTIFDYWTVDTIRRWRNGGKFDSSLLTDEEKNLKEFYTQTLRLAEEEPAFSEGLFWDLMYVNGHLDRQYAFLRSDKNKTYLVVANFSDENITTDIRIPADAIRSLAPETEKVKNNLAHDVIVSVKMKAWDGIVKKIKL
jgi:glycosidase